MSSHPPPPRPCPVPPTPAAQVRQATPEEAERFQGGSAEDVARAAARRACQAVASHQDELWEVKRSLDESSDLLAELDAAGRRAAALAAAPAKDERDARSRRPSRER